jgi:hypothetical protein
MVGNGFSILPPDVLGETAESMGGNEVEDDDDCVG